MDIHPWKQNVLIEPTIRIASDSNVANYHYFLCLDANGWTQRLYSRAAAGGDFTQTPLLVNQGFTLYGDLATQWSANAFLYELYRTKSFGYNFAPASFMGVGTQGASWTVYDPTGVITADIREGLDLDAQFFTGVSDAANVQVKMSVRNTSRTLNINNLLFAEQ